MSNIQNASGAHFAAVNENPKTKTFLEQRARLLYSAKASDDLKLVTHFELDYSKFGDESYSVNRGKGGALGGDEINLETKHLSGLQPAYHHKGQLQGGYAALG